MRKFLTRTIAVAAMALGIAAASMGTASAQADPGLFPPYPSVASQQEIWNQGGAHFGQGAAELTSAAVLGIPAAFMDYGEEIAVVGHHFATQSGGFMPFVG